MTIKSDSPSDATRMAMSQGMLHMARAYRGAADQMLAELGVSQATAWPIVIIRRLGEGVRQKDIAEELGIEAPSLVRLLDQLEASGLAVRKLDPEDGRSKTLYLTDAGRRIAKDIEQRLTRSSAMYRQTMPKPFCACSTRSKTAPAQWAALAENLPAITNETVYPRRDAVFIQMLYKRHVGALYFI